MGFIQSLIENCIKNYHQRRNWQKVVTVLAAIVVFWTTYLLILPAITWEKQLICDKEEHVHTEACYEWVDAAEFDAYATGSDALYDHAQIASVSESGKVKILVCDIPEHKHSAVCFDAPPAEEPEWQCDMEEHVHDESCYFEDGSLKCTIPEHIHTEECDCIIFDDVNNEETTIAIQCTESDGKYILTADVPEDKTGNFIWQWQKSEDGEDPWESIEGAEGLTYEILKEDVAEDVWIRIKGIQNSDNGENDIESDSTPEASPSEATVSEVTAAEATESEAPKRKLMKAPMLMAAAAPGFAAAAPESSEDTGAQEEKENTAENDTVEENALLSEPVMLLGAGSSSVLWERVTDLSKLSPSDTVVIISENTYGGNRAFTLQHTEYDNDQLVGSADAIGITSAGDGMYEISNLGDMNYWSFTASTGGTWQIVNHFVDSAHTDSKIYLDPARPTQYGNNLLVFHTENTGTPANVSVTAETTGKWRFANGSNYIRGNGTTSSAFAKGNSTNAGSYTIFKEIYYGTRHTGTGYEVDVYTSVQGSTEAPVPAGTAAIGEGAAKTIAEIASEIGLEGKVISSEYKKNADSTEKIEDVSKLETADEKLNVYAEDTDPEETVTGNDPRALYLIYQPPVTYWEKVTTITSGEEYVIVSSADNAFRLNNSKDGITAQPAVFTPVPGADNLYSTPANLENTSRWTVTGSTNNWTVKNNSSTGSNNYNLYPSRSLLINSTNGNVRLTGSSTGWTISRQGSNTYYVSGTGASGSAFGTTTNSGSAGKYTIYKPYTGGTRKTTSGYEVDVYVSEAGSTAAPELKGKTTVSEGTQKTINQICTDLGISGTIVASDYKLSASAAEKIENVSKLETADEKLNIYAEDTDPEETVEGNDPRALYLTYQPPVTYWEKVTEIVSGEEYVIVSSADNAFKLNGSRNGIEGFPAVFTKVDGADNLYSTPANLENTSRWTVTGSSNNWTIKNNASTGSNNYNLYPSRSSLINSTNGNVRLTGSSTGWTISRQGSNTYYVSGTGASGSAFGTTTSSGSAGKYTIYKPYTGGTRKTPAGYAVAVYVSKEDSGTPVLVKSVEIDAGNKKNIAEIAAEVGIEGIISDASYHDPEGSTEGYIPEVKELSVLEDGSILNIISADTVENVSGYDKRALYITYIPLDYDKYPKIRKVTGEKKDIATSLDGVDGIAYSDPSTSDIEKEYRDGNPYETSPGKGIIEHNGRVRTDKSVVYMGDDYDAFSHYDPNTFGVTLSAMAQGYDLYADLEVTSPTDVMLVLDCSVSMLNNSSSGSSAAVDRAKNAITAINRTIKQLMDNPGNRVGLVLYSNYGHEFLPLDRYYTGGDEYITLVRDSRNTSAATIKTATGLRNSAGETVTKEFKGDRQDGGTTIWGYTYTQAGIAMGSTLLGRAEDKVYKDTRTLTYPDGSTEDVQFSITRTPVLMHVTDGNPTVYTEDWNNVNYSEYPDNVELNNGAIGYYVVKTEKYYVDKIRTTYGKMPVYFTLGFGDFGNPNSDATKYATAVLNPTGTNIESVNKSGTLGRSFYQLMGADGNYQSDKDYYDCATEAFIEGESDVDIITERLRECVTSTTTMRVYGILLKNTTGVKVTDPIGAGMEVKGAPKLVYGYGATGYGTAIEPTSITAEGNQTVYHYSFEYADPHGSGYVIHSDNKITATVETGANGLQTVIFNVPYESMPLYNRVIGYGNRPTDYFYEQLPLRLIYQVGLTEESETIIRTTAGTKTYYTNRLVDENNPAAYCLYVPTNKNPFYNHTETPDYETPQFTEYGIPKDPNTTQTANESWSVAKDTGTEETVIDYRDSLGNNGKLVFEGAAPGIEIPVDKKWVDAQESEKIEVSAGLYTIEGTGGSRHFEPVKDYLGNPAIVKLNQENGWTDTFSVGAPTSGKPYYIMEINSIPGFVTEYRTEGEKVETVTIGTDTAALASDDSGQPIPISISNIKMAGTPLPSTGGCGKEIFYILGVLLLTGAGTYVFETRRRRKRR